MNTNCTCENKKEHEPWCDLAEDFSATPGMKAAEAKRIAGKDANAARFNEVVAMLGNAPWGLWEKVTRNPELTAAQIAKLIQDGSI